MHWIGVFQSLGLFSIGVAALTWLGRSIATQILSRDVERYKSRLQREALEHQVRFTRIHEKQAEVLEQYYNHLRCARDCLNAFRASKDSPITALDRDFLEKAFEFCIKAATYHRSNELYFQTSISDRAKALELEILKYSAFSSGVLGLMEESTVASAPEDRKRMVEAALKGGLQDVKDQISPLLGLLKGDFQRLIGVNNEGQSH